MPERKTRAAIIAALTLLASLPAVADEAQKLYVQGLAATCANCHGTGGRAVKDAALPGLAGLSAEHIATQMQAFRNGGREATIMHQIAKGYSDAQIRQLAEFFAAQKP